MLTFADGSYYQGQFQKNEISGFGNYYWPDGKSYAGNWSKNKMDG